MNYLEISSHQIFSEQEPAVFEAICEYPNVLLPDRQRPIRIIEYPIDRTVHHAVSMWEILAAQHVWQQFLPHLFQPIQTTIHNTTFYAIALDEYAQGSTTIALRTCGANTNIYTGNINILNEAEYSQRSIGEVDRFGYGISEALTQQAKTIAELLLDNNFTARMSAFSVVITKVDDPKIPFIFQLKIRDFAQITQQSGKLFGYPIWGAECFYGMIETALWFHHSDQL